MADSWQSFLQSQSLIAPVSAGDDNAIYPLPHQFLQVKGPDASKFLQGQLSCDVNPVSLTHSSIGSHNTPKGRMLSSFRLLKNAEESYLLRVDASITDSAKAALAKYIVFSKADITHREDLQAFGLHGEQARQALQQEFAELPDADYQQLSSDTYLIICTSATTPSYEIIGTTDALITLWQTLNEKLTSYSAAQHQLLEHKLGLAFVGETTQDEFIPQMFNYQLTPAVNFKKGCYTGQEIVARMQYLGKLKRHMYRYHCHSTQSLQAGQKLFMAEKNQSIGDIASAIALPDDQWDLLLVLTDPAAEAKQLQTEQGELQQLTQLTLPYSWDEE